MKNKLKDNLKNFWTNFRRVLRRPEMAILPGQLAFFLVLAIVPTITFITLGASLINVSTDYIYDFLSTAFSTEIADLLLNVNGLSGVSGVGIAILLVFGFYIASNGAASIIVTSNTIYGEKQASFINRRLKAAFMTLILILIFIFMLLVPVFGKKIIELIESVNMNPNITARIVTIFDLLKGPLSWLIIYFAIKILYSIAPNKQVKIKSVTYGSLFTSVGWILVTSIYSYYINNIAQYSNLYGGLANMAILMLWFYLLAYIFTIGMALNYRREEEELEKTGTIKMEDL